MQRSAAHGLFVSHLQTVTVAASGGCKLLPNPIRADAEQPSVAAAMAERDVAEESNDCGHLGGRWRQHPPQIAQRVAAERMEEILTAALK